MSDHHEQKEERDFDLLEELGYEPTDTAAESPVGTYTVVFFGFLIVMMAVSWAFLTVVDRVNGYGFTQEKVERKVVPPAGTPILQSDVTARKDMYDIREQEAKKINEVAWVDDAHTTAKISVDDAKRIILSRGLPTRENPVTTESVK